MGLIAAAGFAPLSFRQLFNHNLPPYLIVHVHAAIYVGWLFLFMLQTYLAASGRIELHKRVGRALVGYGALMVVVGLAVTWNRYTYMVHAGQIDEARRVNLAPLVDMLAFPIFFGAAIYWRHTPSLHKRLMLVATTILLYPALVRAGFPTFLRNYFSFMAIWSSPLWLSMISDYTRHRAFSFVYPLGIATLFVLSARTAFVDCAVWTQLTLWLNHFVA